jgi:two-component system, cell cycle sensor histidine kinase and response regulator CckA
MIGAGPAWLPAPIIRGDKEMPMMSREHAGEALGRFDAGPRSRVAVLKAALPEKLKALSALCDSEKRYRRLFESAKDGILILDAETGRVDDVNPFLLELLGYSYETFTGKYLWDIGVFKNIVASKEAFRSLQVDEYIRYDDLPLETRDGRVIAVEFVSNVYWVDRTRVIQCNIRDITATKHAEAERKRLMAAIEQSGEAIVITDARGAIQFVNPSFEQVTGYAGREVMGLNPRILKSGRQDAEFYRALWETISSGRTWRGRMVNKRKDGTTYTEATSISPVRDSDGRIVNYVSVKRDISETLRLAAQFQQAQKMEAVGQLAGGVAHDFNNMLGVILGYAELALARIEPTEPLHADLEEIVKAARRSTVITRQLLAFARKQAIAPVVLDLNRTIDNMLNMLRRLISGEIELVWRPGAPLWAVRMDPGQIDQILANLCVNARDAIGGAGKIAIETENVVFDETDRVPHVGFPAGEYVRLSVGDDGCGMEKEILDQIFEPFFTTKRMGRGTGLGLSTVYGIVQQNGGFIDVCSEPGNGTIFNIHLPRDMDRASGARTAEKAPVPSSRGETVLVVEDEPGILKLCHSLLEPLGYRVLLAARPSEAIELAEARAGGIDLLLTDVVMPEMNGQALEHRLKALCPGIKTVFMSGYSAHLFDGPDVPVGGSRFLKKPFSRGELAEKLREVLAR